MDTDDQLNIFHDVEWKIQIFDTYNSHKAIENCFNYACSGNEYLEDDIEQLEKALYLNSKQMIVMFCTYIEVMIKDFLYTVYQEHPNKIEKHLPKEFSGQFQKLISKNLLDTDSISIFANIAAKKSFDFELNKTLNIICDVCEESAKLSKDCKEKLLKTKENLKKIFKIRNIMIHENKDIDVDLDKIITVSYMTIAPDFIKMLDEYCIKLNISVVKERKQKAKEEIDNLLKDLL